MKSLFLSLCFSCLCATLGAQEFIPNYDEGKIPAYALPAILEGADGQKVETVDAWEGHRRAEILQLFKQHVYGEVPQVAYQMKVKAFPEHTEALNKLARRKQIRFTFKANGKTCEMDLLIYLPADAMDRVPIFLGYNFYGNHTIHEDKGIKLTDSWVRTNEEFGITGNQATKASRGVRSHRWPVEDILERGYGVATIYYGDIDPDYDDGFQNGIHPLFYRRNQSRPLDHEWGSIAAWAWGLSRAMDYLQTDRHVDYERVAVVGHSRLGKAALWAGAMDERFAMVISNESGCGGAALSRRRIGETVGRINRAFPHWFNETFNDYNENEDALPVDQHMLMALMAPRPLYIASAQGDQWADPKGEFLSGKLAAPVYELYGLKGLPSEEQPPLGEQRMKQVGYHVRAGKHDLTALDWELFMNFADKHW